jgi:hypothetical protein
MSQRQAWAVSSVSFAGIAAICFYAHFPEWGWGAIVVSVLMGIESFVKD